MDAWRIIGWSYIAGIEGVFLMVGINGMSDWAKIRPDARLQDLVFHVCRSTPHSKVQVRGKLFVLFLNLLA